MLSEMLSEQDLEYAAQFREGIHREALERVRAAYPDADGVADRFGAEDYFQEVWDYPGRRYPVVGTPPGTGGRLELVEAIVRQTLERCRSLGLRRSDAEFYRLAALYPEAGCDHCLLGSEDRCAAERGVFPFRGPESHRLALGCALPRLCPGDGAQTYDLSRAGYRRLSGKALLAPSGSDEWLNYRGAFLRSRGEGVYTDRDFDRINAALFPAGTSVLDALRWTSGLPGRLSGGALCLTVYDSSLDRFAVIVSRAR